MQQGGGKPHRRERKADGSRAPIPGRPQEPGQGQGFWRAPANRVGAGVELSGGGFFGERPSIPQGRGGDGGGGGGRGGPPPAGRRATATHEPSAAGAAG